LDVRDRVLIAIIADPIAPVYSFQARRPPTRMPRGLSHGCNNFNAATAASFNQDCAFVLGLESMLLRDPPQNPFSTASTLSGHSRD
jgi:hypothetical protein